MLDDPATAKEGRRKPEVFDGKSVGGITDHVAEIIKRLDTKPAIVGHSFGGLIAQKLAGQGLASVSVPKLQDSVGSSTKRKRRELLPSPTLRGRWQGLS